MIWGLGAPTAWAHPLSGALPAHALRVQVEAGSLEVDYRLRVPLHDVQDELRAAGVRALEGEAAQRWTERRLGELAQGLRLTVGGVAVAWDRSEPGRTAGDSRYVHLDQVLHAPLPPDAAEVRLSLGNLPDQTSFFRTELWVGEGLRVQRCSLLDVEGGRVRRSRDGRWLAEESARELTVALAPPPGPLLGRLERLGGMPVEPRPVEQAMALGAVHTLRSGQLPAVGVVLALAGALLAPARGALSPMDGLGVGAALALGWGASPALGALCMGLWGAGRLAWGSQRPRQALALLALGLAVLGALAAG